MRTVSLPRGVKPSGLLVVPVLLLGLVGITLTSVEAQTSMPSERVLLISLEREICILDQEICILDGEIDIVATNRVKRGLEQAFEEDYNFAIIRIDTPGGTIDATRDIVNLIVDAPIPIVTYVAGNSHADVAGTFVAVSGHLFVMAPGSSIGVATPSKNEITDDSYSTQRTKGRESVLALLRSIAELRGKVVNAIEALENTIQNDASYSASEALDLGIADFMVSNIDELLATLDGQAVVVGGSEITIKSQDVELVSLPFSFFEFTFLRIYAGISKIYGELVKWHLNLVEAFINVTTNTNIIDDILFVLGIALLIVGILLHRFIRRGAPVVGALGLIMTVIGGFLMTQLPHYWLVAVLLALGLVLFTFERRTPGFGVLGIQAIMSFVLSVLFLSSIVSTTQDPTVATTLVLLLAIVIAIVMILGLVLSKFEKKNRKNPQPPDAGQ